MLSSLSKWLFSKQAVAEKDAEDAEEQDPAQLQIAARELTANAFKLYLAGCFDEAVASSALQNEVLAEALSPGQAGADALVSVMALSMCDLDAAAELLFGEDIVAMGPFKDLLALVVEGESEWHSDANSTLEFSANAAHKRVLRMCRRVVQHKLGSEQLYDLSQWVVDMPIKVHWLNGPTADADTLLCILPGRGNLDGLATMVQTMEPPLGCNIAGIEADDGLEYAQSKNPLTKYGEQLLFANRLRKFLEGRPEANLLLAAFGNGCSICWQVLLGATSDLRLRRVALLSAGSLLQRMLATDDAVRNRLENRRLLWAYSELEDPNGTFDATADWLSEVAPSGAVEVAKYAEFQNTMVPGALIEAGQFLFSNRGWL